ncbi:pectate lyase [Modicisalibacter luteus]|uniref:Pectate lyase n=3 Tax=Modicisalibacter luteus TaxID=453962 RepID=A0ABV7M4Z9_9GAMM|nr:pectate lyase [Halomonas lutea]
MGQAGAAEPVSPDQVRSAMKEATHFMVDEVATNGGYVWSYLPDFSRRWGEMEAYDTMVWVQPPGTATMGHTYLDAYHATGDEFYYQAATEVANALIWGQTEAGGWNYMFDFAGPKSQDKWYETIGKNGWRLEEFQHNWGNATFDDLGTSEASQLLLRLYLEKRDPKYLVPLEKTIDFVLESQFASGGWPQRYPENDLWEGDYTSYITLNDEVAAQNIKFLIMAYQSLGPAVDGERILNAIYRGMNSLLFLQQGKDQPGWALQYTHDFEPAAARTYEPKSLATHTTASAVNQLMDFYELTGQSKFLARIPEALDWLASVKLPEDKLINGRAYPTFIEIGTKKPLYVHRRGSNVVNGEYFVDHNPENTLGHYSPTRNIDLEGLRKRYQSLAESDPREVSRNSPLVSSKQINLPEYFVTNEISVSDLNAGSHLESEDEVSAEAVSEIVSSLNESRYWPTQLVATTYPYAGPGDETVPEGDYAQTHVGDKYDTSPYVTDNAVEGISIAKYIENMSTLISYLRQVQTNQQ